MADLPKWATNEEAAAAGEGDLADKLVDEAVGGGEDKPDVPEDGVPEHAPPPESGLASRALCFFRFLAVLTVLLALAVIGTNCYIIYDKFKDLKGELLLVGMWFRRRQMVLRSPLFSCCLMVPCSAVQVWNVGLLKVGGLYCSTDDPMYAHISYFIILYCCTRALKLPLAILQRLICSATWTRRSPPNRHTSRRVSARQLPVLSLVKESIW